MRSWWLWRGRDDQPTDIRIIADYWPSGTVQRVWFGDRAVNTILATATPFGTQPPPRERRFPPRAGSVAVCPYSSDAAVRPRWR